MSILKDMFLICGAGVTMVLGGTGILIGLKFWGIPLVVAWDAVIAYSLFKWNAEQ